MVYQTYTLVIDRPVNFYFAGFVFFSTVCSYNFHWALTPNSIAPSHRLKWDERHKRYHFLLSVMGLIGSIIFFLFMREHWFSVGVAAIFTFLYSAPKISFPPFQWLKNIAVGKTIFLALTWAYVTAALPVLIEGDFFSPKPLLFFTGQLLFIYAICILFDFRDRDDDKADGIRSMITFFNERGIDLLFSFSIVAYIIMMILLYNTGLPWFNIILLIFPALLAAGLYGHAKRNFSDYLYYFILDGLMMLSGLLLWFVHMF